VRDVLAHFIGGMPCGLAKALRSNVQRLPETANHATIASIAVSYFLTSWRKRAETDAMHRETLEVLQRVLGAEYPVTLKTVNANRPWQVRWRRGGAP
jgi:hypothetical protein